MNISLKEFINKQSKENLNIIDIRSAYLYRMGNIKNSINIPYEYLLQNPENYLKKGAPYYLYCMYGSTSNKVADRLNKLGYQTISIDSGYLGYKSSNL